MSIFNKNQTAIMNVEQCGKSICQIEVVDDQGHKHTGTGFCVSVAGFPVIATNCHVVKSLAIAQHIVCRFSKFLSHYSSVETIVKCTKDSVPCFWDADQHHQLVYNAEGQCTNKLDFVFIRCTLLDKLIASRKIVPLHFESHHLNFQLHDRVVIWGHPQGSPLCCSFGAVTAVSANTITYDVGTHGGSSGSPIFSAKSGNVVGIHHSATLTDNYGTLSFAIVEMYMRNGIREVFNAARDAQEESDKVAIAYTRKHLQCHACKDLFTRKELNSCVCEQYHYCDAEKCAITRLCKGCQQPMCGADPCVSFTCAGDACGAQYCGACCGYVGVPLDSDFLLMSLGIKDGRCYECRE